MNELPNNLPFSSVRNFLIRRNDEAYTGDYKISWQFVY